MLPLILPSRPPTGRDFKLSDQKGKVVDPRTFGQTWCPPCRLKPSHVQSVSQDKALGSHKNVVVCAVNVRESADERQQVPPGQPLHVSKSHLIHPDRPGQLQGDRHSDDRDHSTEVSSRKRIHRFGDDSAKQIDNAIQQVVGN